MPWISVTVPGATPDSVPPASVPPRAQALATDLARAVAAAAGLAPHDVIVLVVHATAASGRGAVVTLAGRRRSSAVESAVLDSIRGLVASAAGVTPDLVAIIRSSPEAATGPEPGSD